MGSNNNKNQPIVNQNPQNPASPGTLPATFTGSFPNSGPGTIRPPGQTTQPGTIRPPSGGDPRGASSDFVNNTTDAFNSRLNPLINQGAYDYSNAAATDAATRAQINQGYQNFGNPSGGSSGGGGSTAGLNTRLPGESSYDWAKRAAIATGRTDIANDPGALQYWADSINSKPQSNDMGYWTDKFTGGGGGGGGGIGGSFGNYNAFTVNPGSYNAAQANTFQSAPAAQAGYTSAGQQYSAAPRSLMATSGNLFGNVQPTDPYNSYAGYQEFAKTGGYSPQDIADLRARGVAPIRAAYDAAARNVGQQRSLQGGYAPNAIAAQTKMAREQGQSMSDEYQNVNAGIIDARNRGMFGGLGGMSTIENARQAAQMQADMFNAGQRFQGSEFDIGNELQNNQFNAGQGNQIGMYNAGQANQVGEFNAGQTNDVNMYNTGQANQVGMFNTGQTNAANQFNTDLDFRGQTFNAGQYTQAQVNQINDQFRALQGQTQLLGTTPAMTNMFGNQLQGYLNTGANFNSNAMGAYNQAQGQQGQFQQDMSRINAIGGLVNSGINTANTIIGDRRTQPSQPLPPPTPFNPYQFPTGTQLGTPPPPTLPPPTPFNAYQFPTYSPQQGDAIRYPNGGPSTDPFQNANAFQFTSNGQGFGYPPYQQNNLSRYGYGGNV